jgi:hypothetical protein
VSTDLIAFLNARLDEDEAAAKAVRQPRNWHQGDESDPWASWDRDMIYMWPPEFHTPIESDKHWRGLQADDDHLAAHIARHDPARVLREVTAKRAIVTRYAAVRRAFGDREGGLWPDVTRREKSHAYATLCDLAGIWSDHPDYQDEWAS